MDNKSGFTLIELIVTIAVIAILAGALMVLINPAKILGNARNAGRASDLRQLANALERYYVRYGEYPYTLDQTGGWLAAPPCNTAWGICVDDWIPGLVASGEVKALPRDPKHEGNTYYLYRSNRTDYKLLMHVPENCALTDKLLDPARVCWSWAVWSSMTKSLNSNANDPVNW